MLEEGVSKWGKVICEHRIVKIGLWRVDCEEWIVLVEHAIVLLVIACQTIINVKNNSSENYFAGLHIHIAKSNWHNTKKNKAQWHVDVSKTDFHIAKRDVNNAKTNVK